ncbi:hypothetical protein [Gloeobacter morelensis]|uniref:hypothetical protein n=1 Tax=Gloeobacter morelensis TaxID=2907343 RepID=UPI001E3868A1|nr:hypothetical protein [Gloeobacter morelensis]UFP97285.1 hypothetical protein ISF26_24500 [Gloeobacter morelensis MG652769]
MARTIRNLVGANPNARDIATESTRRAEIRAADLLIEAGYKLPNRLRSRAHGTDIPNAWDDLAVSAWSEVHRSKLPVRF